MGAPTINALPEGLSSTAALEMVAALTLLGKVGPQAVGDDDVKFHEDPTERAITLPRNSTYDDGIAALQAKKREQEQITKFTRTYKFRPDDGANATANVLKERFGITVGITTRTMFGEIPPEIKTITIGYGKTRQVPWGRMGILSLTDAEIYLGDTYDPEYGPCYQITVKSPRKWKKELEGLFDAVQAELEANSIYRGHALCGANTLEFLDLSKFDPTKIQFSDRVTDVLETALLGAIRHSDAMLAEGIPLKRTFLLCGPYGTGKSSVGMIAAQEAEKHGWTFLMGKTGRDSITEVLRTAKLYQRAVVFVEDIDTQADTTDKDAVAELLETFDGITAKDSQIMLVMTTNHKDRIHAGMLRPGRVDYVVEIGELDRNGTERLIRATVPKGKLAANVDFDAVYDAMSVIVEHADGEKKEHRFEPAFVKETVVQAKTWALISSGGKPKYTIGTDSLVRAALALHPQLTMLKTASEGIPEPGLVTAFRGLVQDVMEDNILVARDGDGALPYAFQKADDRD
jgi:hypothetical protein